VAEGKDLRVRFYGKRCIHARYCVLWAPKVFKANTPGEWIFPDAMSTDTVLRVAYSCPSGASQFDRRDGGLEEEAPPVNVMNIRENGQYAIRAPMTVGGESIGHRATLCRCGASRHKPFCDGTHNTIGFTATGEAETRNTESLAVRDGPITLAPEKNGPPGDHRQLGNLLRHGPRDRPRDHGAVCRWRLAHQAVLRLHAPPDRLCRGRRIAGYSLATGIGARRGCRSGSSENVALSCCLVGSRFEIARRHFRKGLRQDLRSSRSRHDIVAELRTQCP
jgi:CDGSH-type Zn-finger protein/uncharacterized Fe-S cluster protein YjdI